MEENQSICEPKVFEEVYKSQSETLRNFIYYKCGDAAAADDFVQEAFIKLWKNCSKVLVLKAKSFLFTVANNLFLNDFAHKKVVLKHQKIKKNSPNKSKSRIFIRRKRIHGSVTKSNIRFTRKTKRGLSFK